MSSIVAVEGAGPSRILVLHGWALDSGIWLTSRALTDQARYTYAYVDFPGYGVARDAESAADLDGMAAVALDAAASLDWDEYSILGHSMGGATAIRAASLAPEKVRSVVALTPVSPLGTPLDEATYDSFRSAWADPGPALSGLAPHVTAEQMKRIVERNRASSSQEVWEQYLANWAGGNPDADLSTCTAATTLVYGDSDPFITADYLSALHKVLPRAAVQSIAGAGHYPMIEQPSTTVQLWETAFTEGATAGATR